MERGPHIGRKKADKFLKEDCERGKIRKKCH